MATMIVTLDSAGARLITRLDGNYNLLEALDHPEGRLRNSEINSDRPGRTHDGKGGSHAMDPEQSPHDRKVADFVRRLCARLDKGRQEKEFSALLIAAEPHLLGLVRSTLDKNTASLITTSLPKNLQPVALNDLDRHLEQAK